MKFDGQDEEVLALLEDDFLADCQGDDGCVVRILTRRSQRYAYVSDNSPEILGVNPVDQLGKSCFEFISPDRTAWVRELMMEATNKPVVSWYQTGQNGEKWVRTESKPIGEFIVGKVRIEDDAAHHQARFQELASEL